MNIFFILIGIVIILYIIKAVMDKNFDIYESIFWIVATIGIILLALFPKSLDIIAIKLGISYSPSLVFLIASAFLLLINFRHTRILAKQKQRTIELIQKVAILEQKLNQKEEKDDNQK